MAETCGSSIPSIVQSTATQWYRVTMEGLYSPQVFDVKAESATLAKRMVQIGREEKKFLDLEELKSFPVRTKAQHDRNKIASYLEQIRKIAPHADLINATIPDTHGVPPLHMMCWENQRKMKHIYPVISFMHVHCEVVDPENLPVPIATEKSVKEMEARYLAFVAEHETKSAAKEKEEDEDQDSEPEEPKEDSEYSE
jgi:hypothetical protein